ncbi:double-strand break repair helicase AddA [Maricaulis parjimensis]|uniref:double-strand break repair helicase AddA n=1 Tax=Maricaulis parjimensis TaxID=144023 RepID=UPI0019394AFF|nr:double-strand break repair helicase AddA [Maricaulis parjimensis]
MIEPGFDEAIKTAATQAQKRAAQPRASVFVEANAGSGKTRVLVDRVVNLLLEDTPPEQILCVTYTKAAAAEMKDRLFARLGAWSMMETEALKADFQKLKGHEPRPDELEKVRRLFARALETPGGLKVQTIHAFCESLLRRFPLEAGAPPGFSTLDDSEAEACVEAARRKVLRRLTDADVDHVLATGGPDAFGQILNWARFNRHHFRDVLDAHGGHAEALVERLYTGLDLTPGQDARTVKVAAWEASPRAELEAAAHALIHEGSKSDVTRGECLQQALSAPDPALAFDAYLPALFIKGGAGTPVAKLVTAKVDKLAPSVKPILEAEQGRMEAARDRVKAAALAEASAIALRIASDFVSAYEAELERRRSLDFDDLIRLAGDLLQPDNPFSGWVGYKLDAALSHALIDEAQDTAPRQWDMIRGLTSEYFSGEGAREGERTLFIVGDEKQSIYSFQGAEPARFIAEGNWLEQAAKAVGLPFERPGLDVSFRSAPQILSAVDQAFAQEAAAGDAETKFLAPEGPRPFSHYQSHQAARVGMSGCVELWPAVPMPEKVEEGSIFDPVDQRPWGSAKDRLAARIASDIRAMIERGDAVWEESGGEFQPRPVTPGDVAILVWRRTGGFFEEMIRQLKLQGVPVAGADRMVLRDQTAVKDMLALARFALTPGDDLALAEVLKSPFFDPITTDTPKISDEELMALARLRKSDRRGSLWAALFTSDLPVFEEAREALKRVRDQADSERLYDFFAAFLNARTPTGETRWARVFARLGEEARDPLEEFLARALKHETEGGGALASFLAGVEREESQLKREMSQGRNEVQVMTVHASKGLEWPVVYLPDTTRSPGKSRPDPIMKHPESGLVWAQRKSDDPPAIAALRQAAADKDVAEHGRLLYVALTRARDRLVVAGWKHTTPQNGGKVDEDSWYARLDKAWSGPDWQAVDDPAGIAEDEEMPSLRRLGPEPQALGAAAARDAKAEALPDWAIVPARPEQGGVRGVAPSSFLGDEEGGFEPAVLSPLSDPGAHRFRRGDVIHKLLQTLPDLPRERRREAAERFVSAQPDFDDAARSVMVEETLGILDHPDFAPLFGPGSRAEVSLVGRAESLPGNVIVRGQVDRLVVTDTEVQIIDYKTNRPPPEDVAAVAKVYIGQLATYRALLRAVHPGKTVRCALLWTDAARLMEVADELMDDVLQGANA